MPAVTFNYTALDSSGAKRTGVVEAETREAAIARLATEGRFVTDISQAGSSGKRHSGHDIHGKVAAQDMAVFTRRLADLARAGLPLDRVLHVVGEQSESPVLQAVCEQALEDVRGGLPVSQALAKHPRLFAQVYTQTLRAGEASGQFGEVAARLADLQEKEVSRRSQIVSALVYPAILSMTALAVITFLMTFVIPKLSGVFKDLGGELPAPTRILIAVAVFIVENWVVVVCSIAAVVVGLRVWLGTPGGAFARDKALLNLPVVGPVITKATVSRFARILGTLVYGGVPILEAIDISGLAAGNRLFAVSAKQVESDVREGRPIAEAMADAGAFPPVLTHMVAIGEETGDLPLMLSRVSDSLDFEVDTGMRRLVALVEPVIVLSMGVFVGYVVVSVLLPIFQAQALVK
ncbi:MAG: type II secretion system F family protein [Armatimonadetes bacterium]|nr:type II secretion system F family protein [Armatimonadota bacterium]